MKKILVATDLSDRSAVAIRRAAWMSRTHMAKLHVVHVVDREWPQKIGRIQRECAENSIKAQLSTIEEFGPIEADVSVVFGDPSADICVTASELEVDLIVAGHHRDRGTAEFFTGTTIERMARLTTLPILIVARVPEAAYDSAVVGIDFSRCSANAVSLAVDLVGREKVTLLHAYHLRTTNPSLRAGEKRGLAALDREKTESFIRQEIEAWKNDQGLKLDGRDVMLRAGGAVNVLSQVASEVGSDLICLGAHGRSWLSSMILGSTVSDLLHHSDFDILIAPL